MRVVIRVDATVSNGVGHIVRQLALAEELLGRGHEVILLGASDVPWALHQAAARGLELVLPLPDVGRQAADLGASVAVIDGYAIPAQAGESFAAAGIGVATMVDGEFGLHQRADLYVDQNLNAIRLPGVRPGADFLGGLDYVLLRDQIRDRRGTAAPRDERAPRVLVVFGGTDAYGGARILVPLLLSTGVPVEVVAVTATSEIGAEIAALEVGPGQSLEVHGPVDDLGGLAVTCHAAVSAAGTTVWELLCLGIPTGLVCVTENQEFGYLEAERTRVSGTPVCLPVGRLDRLRSSAADRAGAIAQVRALASDGALRSRMAAAARTLVDGDGRVRVADAVEALAQR
jgi:spore coat polysaccharide biosynthesis predicted glycosyltransferase SpsG